MVFGVRVDENNIVRGTDAANVLVNQVEVSEEEYNKANGNLYYPRHGIPQTTHFKWKLNRSTLLLESIPDPRKRARWDPVLVRARQAAVRPTVKLIALKADGTDDTDYAETLPAVLTSAGHDLKLVFANGEVTLDIETSKVTRYSIIGVDGFILDEELRVEIQPTSATLTAP